MCSHFCDGVEVSRGDRLKHLGIPTARDFTENETVSLRILQAAVAVPGDFGMVTSIRPAGPGKVAVTGESGASVETSLDWNFVL